MQPAAAAQGSTIETAAQILTVAALLFVLHIGLLAALLSGLLIYQLVQFVLPLFRRLGVNRSIGKALALTLLAVVICVPIALGIAELTSWVMRGFSDVAALLQKMAEVIDTARAKMPAWMLEYIPANTAEFQDTMAGWLRENAGRLGLFSQDVGRLLFHIIVGLIIGGVIAFQGGPHMHESGPLAGALMRRVILLARAFKNVVFSQVRISALNTVLTTLYLLVLLPLLGMDVPLVKTMIAVTFIAGLLPVVGNLISNTVIVVVSLSVSLTVAMFSLIFLVVIHKLEYFVNARIIGSQIRAQAWELLIVMLVMEATFGLAGVVAGPIYYAYLKSELTARGLI